MNIVGVAFVLLPDVFELRTSDEHEVVVADDFAGVANHSAAAGSVFHEIEFAHVMIVDGVVEFRLMTVGHIHEVAFSQRGYFVQDSRFHEGRFSLLISAKVIKNDVLQKKCTRNVALSAIISKKMATFASKFKT
jgi:hypothetical protein